MAILRSVQDALFTAGVTCASRIFLLRDRMNGRLREVCAGGYDGSEATRLRVGAGRAALDAVYVRPAAGEIGAAVLICHGIGEVVEHWRGVQHLLAMEGVASLVFDYSGYGRSAGWVTTAGCEANAVAAFESLRERVPGVPVSLLGFSLGSGVACAVAGRIEVQSLVLCGAFTSFRDALRRIGLPGWMGPAVWDNQAALGRCSAPVLVMHGERDALFPAAMARRLGEACGGVARVEVFPGLAHDDAYFCPRREYWRVVAGHTLTG